MEEREIMLQKMKEREMVGRFSGTPPVSFAHIPYDTAALSTHCGCISDQTEQTTHSDYCLIMF